MKILETETHIHTQCEGLKFERDQMEQTCPPDGKGNKEWAEMLLGSGPPLQKLGHTKYIQTGL